MNEYDRGRFPLNWNMPGVRVLLGSIKGQIFIVFALTFLSMCSLTLLNLWSLATVKDRLLLGEHYDDLNNNILEVRRFEKNYLFFNDRESFLEGLDYLERIDGLVKDYSKDIISVTSGQAFETFRNTLLAYEHTLKSYESDGRPVSSRENLRLWGKFLVDFAEKLIITKRVRIHETIAHASFLPFMFLATFFCLMFLVITLISQGLLKPLGVLQTTIQRVARGDFSPIPYEGLHTDEISGLIGAFNRMARELENNQEDLLQARKIAALGTFTAGIAHELNNPINNIHLTAETFLEEYRGKMDADAKEMIHDILSQADRAGDIVRNLLDFSRTERPAFADLEVGEIIRSTVALIRNQIMLSGIKLECLLPSGLPHVRGNMRNLQQVFMNLLLNAIQATPIGGEITIAAEPGPKNFVCIDVADTGEGIPPEVLQHIFEPFYTTKEVGRGTGLGLAVTYAIVKRHGGHIEVRSEAEKGSSFSVYLPRV